MSTDSSKNGGIGLLGLTFVVLLVLKLTNLAPGLSWFWVWFPLWIGPAIVVVIFCIYFLLELVFPDKPTYPRR